MRYTVYRLRHHQQMVLDRDTDPTQWNAAQAYNYSVGASRHGPVSTAMLFQLSKW